MKQQEQFEIDYELMKTLENLGHSDLLERYWTLLTRDEVAQLKEGLGEDT